MKFWLNAILALWLAFPLAAQERVETCCGPVERRQMTNGTSLVLQPLPNQPVVALTLVFPWGRRHASGYEILNRLLSRCSGQYPGGSLLLRLEEIGGQIRYQTGGTWSSFSLIVPRGYASWALAIQLERLAGPWYQKEDLQGAVGMGAPSDLDSATLESLFLQRWNPSQAVLSVAGGYDDNLLELLRKGLPARKDGPPNASPLGLVYRPQRLAWSYPRPQASRQRAALWLWKAAVNQVGEVELDLDTADDCLWLSTSLKGQTSAEQARPSLQAALPGAFKVTGQTRQQAVRLWLEQWDDLGARSRLLALEQARGELGNSLQTYESLVGYDLSRWPQDLVSVVPAEASAEVVTPLAAAPLGESKAGLVGGQARLKARPGASPPRVAPAGAVPFIRLEPVAGCPVLVQSLPDLPAVQIRALIPGGSSYDTAANAGRAQWLGACWQELFGGDYATRVEIEPFGWQFSAYLTRDQVGPWIHRFFQLWGNTRLDPTLVAGCQPRSDKSEGPVQQAYQQWLKLLFPVDHPWGRSGMVVALTPERLQELQSQVQQRGRWNLFLSGDVTGSEVEKYLQQVSLPQPDSSLGPAEGLPTQADLPTQPVVISAEVDKCTLLLGGYAPSRKESDYYAFVLLLQALAGDPLRGRLPRELRFKDNLAQRVDVNLLSSSGVSPWLLRVDCGRENLSRVQQRIQDQFQDLIRQPLKKDELDLAVSRLEGQFQVSGVNSSGRLNQLRNIELFRLSDSYNQGFAGIYRNVSAKDIQASARLRLQPQRLATVVVTPK